MNFTREPIIETVITPRDGCKLILRNSKGGADEEFIVEAVEVVSFGRSFFFRSVESSKTFLLPVTDYEILESKEARIVLKNVQPERQIKIGGGREAGMRQPKMTEEAPRSNGDSYNSQQDRKQGGGRRRRGRRGRGGGDRPLPPPADGESAEPAPYAEEPEEFLPPEASSTPTSTEEPKAPSFISKLFPPPPTLIKETLSRYKTTEEPEPSTGEKIREDDTIFDHPVSDDPDEDLER
ncbi:MAG: hypothetical protein HY069_00300 [Chlamydiia bacterium]|nr:hypothetical protein [Chlamydiia bacterium]